MSLCHSIMMSVNAWPPFVFNHVAVEKNSLEIYNSQNNIVHWTLFLFFLSLSISIFFMGIIFILSGSGLLPNQLRYVPSSPPSLRLEYTIEEYTKWKQKINIICKNVVSTICLSHIKFGHIRMVLFGRKRKYVSKWHFKFWLL